jgi:hypothetical protein
MKEVTAPREACEKPWLAGDHMRHAIRSAGAELSSDYDGISPEQELAVQGIRAATAPAAGGPAGPGDADVIAGRAVPASAGAEPQSEELAGGGAMPTGLSSSIGDALDKLRESIEEQIKAVGGFTVKLQKEQDGSLTVSAKIEPREDTTSPPGGIVQSAVYGPGETSGAGDADEQGATGTAVGEPGRTVLESSVHEESKPVTVRIGIGAQASVPTQDDADTVSNAISAGANASSRENELIHTDIACVKGVSLVAQVTILNVTINTT